MDSGKGGPPLEELIAKLDRFASTPTGSLTLVLLTAAIRLALPGLIRIHRRRKPKPKRPGAAPA